MTCGCGINVTVVICVSYTNMTVVVCVGKLI